MPDAGKIPPAKKDERRQIETEQHDAHAEPHAQHGLHPTTWALVAAAVLSSTFLFALDNTIVTVVQPKIIQDFGHIDRLPWISVAYAACNFSTILAWCVKKSFWLEFC